MTKEEREKLLMVISNADGGCSTCVYGLLERLAIAFPDEPSFKLEFEEAGPDAVRAQQMRWDHRFGRAELAWNGWTPGMIEEEARERGWPPVTP